MFAIYKDDEYPKITAETETHSIAKYNANDFIINLPLLLKFNYLSVLTHSQNGYPLQQLNPNERHTSFKD